MSAFDDGIKNAVIESARIDIADGFLSIWLTLDYGGTGQGFGGWSLGGYSFEKQGNWNHAGWYLRRCMEIAGVAEWDRIVGKTIRADGTHTGIKGIGHIVKDDWFYPERDFERAKARGA